ncbi:WD40-repeat-containing domain protein [Aspergillus crustosus]
MTTPTHPAATPTYILRGHVAAIHALQVFNNNLRLASGDADGWIVIWDLIFKRPVAVWKAHEGAVLEVKAYSLGGGRVTEIYTHGRDHKLRVWRIRVQDEEILQKRLPVDASLSLNQSESASQTQPWLIHSLTVNALNFCAFSILFLPRLQNQETSQTKAAEGQGAVPPSSSLIAVPNALDSGAIDLFHLPSERRVCTIPTDPSVKTGMVMAARLIRHSPSSSETESESETETESGDLYVASAYEDGHVMVFVCRGFLSKIEPLTTTTPAKKPTWETLYISRPHTQPALSIDVTPSGTSFISSSADANLVKHPIPLSPPDSSISISGTSISTSTSQKTSKSPIKTVNTKHAGQQGLRIRSDGKIFATAGWDSRVRVYSVKTMRELAVLKWHREGCYAVAFGEVLDTSASSGVPEQSQSQSQSQAQAPAPVPAEAEAEDKTGEKPEAHETEKRIIQPEKEYSHAQVQHQRSLKVQNTHWLVAGSKDGKISLWDIY